MENERTTCPNELNKPSLFFVLFSPNEQFKRLKELPKIVFPLVIVTVITVIGIILSAQGIDLIENDPELLQMTEEELGIFLLFTQTIFAIIGMMTPVITIVISTTILFVLAKIIRSSVSFKQLFALNTFVFLLHSFNVFVNGVGLLFFGEIHGDETMFTNINLFFGAKGWLGAILTLFDIFTVWAMILLWKGLRIIGEFSVGAANIVILGAVLIHFVTFLIL